MVTLASRSYLWAVFLALALVAPHVYGTETIRAIKCDCDSMQSMQMAAANGAWQQGSIVLVSSETWPISAYFVQEYNLFYLPPWYAPVNIPWAFFITLDETTAAQLDNKLYARAAQLQPVEIPPEVADSASADPELFEPYITSQAGPFTVLPGPPRVDIWHMITHWGTLSTYYEVLDKRNGEVSSVHIGDTVVIKFQDQSTLELRFWGPEGPAGKIFEHVSGSERDANGSPFTGYNGAPSNPVGGTAFTFDDLFAYEAEPRYDCAINIIYSICDVNTYGGPTQCLFTVRQTNVPCP
jgi:hypothetical protein